jgi:hypothetical protein
MSKKVGVHTDVGFQQDWMMGRVSSSDGKII